MKKLFKYGTVITLLTVPVITLAAEFRTSESLSISKDEKLINNIYLAGGSVTSAGSIVGDLLAAGGNVLVSGDVSKDLFAAGGNISVLSNIGDDVRAAGGTVVIAGKIGGDLLVGGGQVSINGLGVGRDVVAGAGTLSIDAPVAGNLLVGGGMVYINAAIGGDVKIEADKVKLGKGAVINGNLTYRAAEEMVKEEGAVVKGGIDFQKKDKRTLPANVVLGIFSAIAIWKFLALLTSSLVVGLVMRRYAREIVDRAITQPWHELGTGLVTAIVIPIAAIILGVTLVGIPFGILVILGYVILMLFAWIITPIIVGSVAFRYVSKKDLEVSWRTIILGVVIYSLLGWVPIIGGLAGGLLILLSLGCIIAFKLRILKEWR